MALACVAAGPPPSSCDDYEQQLLPLFRGAYRLCWTLEAQAGWRDYDASTDAPSRDDQDGFEAEASAAKEVRAAAVDIAMAATRSVLAEKLDAKTAGDMVDAAIKELPDRLN